ncbi:helix-turn-helix domain-containing protein [Heyndrickxia ginsengihumi]|uniref:helix-turn-helix domain-containing protein n=1 Tax=Heyndrickxia ginsengihumi TaxID=363870 RepID=UPI003D1F8E12
MDILDMAVNDFGSLVKLLRVRKGWTLEQLAERAGCSSSFIFRIEQNMRNPSLDRRLAVLIGLEVSDEVIGKYVQQVISKKEGMRRLSS